MCRTVGEVRDALVAIVAGLDPDSVALPVAPAVWEHFDAVERLAGAAKVLLARRVEASRAWRRAGYRSAAEYLAAKEGGSVGGARQQLETSEKLAGTPRAEAALRDGTLSAPQARAVVDAASANPAAEARLVGEARRASLNAMRRCAGERVHGPGKRFTRWSSVRTLDTPPHRPMVLHRGWHPEDACVQPPPPGSHSCGLCGARMARCADARCPWVCSCGSSS